jgi:hypothetical protein
LNCYSQTHNLLLVIALVFWVGPVQAALIALNTNTTYQTIANASGAHVSPGHGHLQATTGDANGGIPDKPCAIRFECERHLLKHRHEHSGFGQRSHQQLSGLGCIYQLACPPLPGWYDTVKFAGFFPCGAARTPSNVNELPSSYRPLYPSSFSISRSGESGQSFNIFAVWIDVNRFKT